MKERTRENNKRKRNKNKNEEQDKEGRTDRKKKEWNISHPRERQERKTEM